MLDYRSLAPHPLLKDLVHRFFIFEGKLSDFVFVQDVIPVLTESITFNLNGHPQFFIVQGRKLAFTDCFVSGLHSQPYQAWLSGDVKMVGAQIKSPGLARLFNVPLKYMTNNALILRDLIGNKSQPICNAVTRTASIKDAIEVIENFLLQKLISTPVSSTQSSFLDALQLINQSKGTRTISSLSKETGRSERSLQRIFMEQAGLSPKGLSRLIKFNQVILHFNTHRNLSPDLIEELGYFDQAHFIHEFKSFSGQSPLTYFKNHPGVNEFFSSQ